MYTNCPPPCRPCGQQKQAPIKGLERRFVLLRVEARRRVLPYCRLQVPCDVRCPRWIPVPHQFPFRHQVAQWYLGRVGPRTSKKKKQAHQGRELAIDKTGGARAVISVERGKQLIGGRFKKTIGRECKGIHIIDIFGLFVDRLRAGRVKTGLFFSHCARRVRERAGNFVRVCCCCTVEISICWLCLGLVWNVVP